MSSKNPRGSRYWSGAHTRHCLRYHLVFVPKYRRRVLRGNVAARLYHLFKQCAELNRWHIEELKILHDHVHMLVQLRPPISVSEAVQLFKGGSSKVIREEHPELEEFLWGDSFWCDGFFAETIGAVDEDVIRKYIREQTK